MTQLVNHSKHGWIRITNVRFDDKIHAKHVELYDFARLVIECYGRKFNVAVSDVLSFLHSVLVETHNTIFDFAPLATCEIGCLIENVASVSLDENTVFIHWNIQHASFMSIMAFVCKESLVVENTKVLVTHRNTYTISLLESSLGRTDEFVDKLGSDLGVL